MAEAWPRIVFEAPLLRGLDARGRAELERAGSLEEVAAGGSVYRRGQRGDDLYVVADGHVVLSGGARGEAPKALREVRPGHSFGEEASIGATWRADAKVHDAATVARLPVALLRRALARAGGERVAERFERRLQRRATEELLQALPLTQDLDRDALEALLDAARHERRARGDLVYRAGERADRLWIVADGMVQLQTEDGERVRVMAYLTRGDFFGDEEVFERMPREVDAVASGAALLLALPAALVRQTASRHPAFLEAFERERRARRRGGERAAEVAAQHTQHAFRDLFRLQTARSMLVIDLATCVRCGHCAWACESLHGVARIVRRGDRMVATRSGEQAPTPMLLPSSCQHCDSPACMPDCPTGAIARDEGGEVRIRDALCTGCGACAKGCPWDNIQIVPRPPGAPRPPSDVVGDGPIRFVDGKATLDAPASTAYADLAVKCDLCHGYDGPACVRACPVEAIARIDPSRDLTEVAALLDAPASSSVRRAPKGPGAAAWVLGALASGAALAVLGLARHANGAWHPWVGVGKHLGVAAAVSLAALFAYPIAKRGVRLWQRRRAPGEEAVRSRVRPWLLAHLVLGALGAGAAVAHGGLLWAPSSGGMAAAAFSIASLLGALGWALYAGLPASLGRLEREALLPEDYGRAIEELKGQLYDGVSGRSDVVKRLFARVLTPYLNAPAGPARLVASRRGLRAERQALRGRIDGILQGRGAERLAGLDRLVELVVEIRAVRAARALTWALRAWLPLHLVASVLALLLLVAHLVEVLA